VEAATSRIGQKDSRQTALTVRGLSKSFGGVHALEEVGLIVLPGEVHGLLGENGSGKSTLIKILAGYHAPDAGELEVHGRAVKLPLHPGQFRELGMSFVHQDLGLITSVSVLENFRIGEFATSRRQWYIAWGRERRRAREIFARFGLHIDPDAVVADLLPVERAMLAVVRAVEAFRTAQGEGRGLLILDEPAVFLPRTGVEQLFSLVREIAASGSSVLFVSHDLDEVQEITDRVTVLRDGHVVGTTVTTRTSKEQLVEMIIGHRLGGFASEHLDFTNRAVAASVTALTGQYVRDISIELHEGEVLGLTGLLGSGFEEIPYLLFGARTCTGGHLTLEGRSYDLRSMTPDRALDLGMSLLPADRQREGAVGSLSIGENVMLQVLRRYFRNLRLDRRRMLNDARDVLTRFDVRPNEPQMTYDALSGGNQQKALLAKWLQAKPALLLLHEPTQGVDVGAREQIFAMIRQTAADGHSILCASSDYEQLAIICDRVLVFQRGRVTQQLVGNSITKDRIAEQAYSSGAVPTAAETRL